MPRKRLRISLIGLMGISSIRPRWRNTVTYGPGRRFSASRTPFGITIWYFGDTFTLSHESSLSIDHTYPKVLGLLKPRIRYLISWML
jgi:hypothetical protein